MEQQTIRKTKYFRPPPRQNHLTRSKLLQRLDDAASCKIILVTASAGFGKTTLISDWLETRKLPYSWLALDDDDGEPISFWRDLITSLQSLRPGIGANSLDILKSGQADRVRECPLLLCDEFAERTTDKTIRHCVVIDDYHVVNHSLTDESMGRLAQLMPPGWQLVLIARTVPAIAIARQRVADEVCHIEHNDMGFTAIESREFMQREHLELSDEDHAVLYDKTEGWAAGLQLAALSMRNISDLHSFVAGLGGDHQDIENYLTEEIMQGLSARMQCFLEALAPLERFCEPLCHALMADIPALGGGNAKTLLDELERLNLFLVPLDSGNYWYRFHHLFRDLLRRRSKVSENRDICLRSAARWLQQHGEIDSALGLALELADVQWVEQLITQGAGLRQSFEVREWLRRLPESTVARSPLLIYVGTAIGLSSGQPREGQYWLNLLTRLGRDCETYCDDPGINTELNCYALVPDAWIDASKGNSDTSSIAADKVARHIASLPAGAQAGRSRLRLVQSEMLFQAGRTDESIAAANDSIKIAATMRMGRIVGSAYGRIGECYFLKGEMHKIPAVVTNGLAAVSEMSAADQINATGFLEKLRGEVLLSKFQLDDAYDLLGALRERAQRQGHHYLDLASGVLLAVLFRCQNQDEVARRLTEQLTKISTEQQIRQWFMPSPDAIRACIDLDMGDLHAAVEWARIANLSFDKPFNHLREYDYLAYARVLAAEGKARQALDLTHRVRKQAQTNGRGRVALEALLLEGIFQERMNLPSGDAIRMALEMGAKEGIVQPFLLERETLPALLEKAAEQGIEKEHVAHIELIARNHVGERLQILSPRELDVLKLMSKGEANKQIAANLSLSLNTIKTHSRNIYDKLTVVNRTQAVSRANALGLL